MLTNKIAQCTDHEGWGNGRIIYVIRGQIEGKGRYGNGSGWPDRVEERASHELHSAFHASKTQHPTMNTKAITGFYTKRRDVVKKLRFAGPENRHGRFSWLAFFATFGQKVKPCRQIVKNSRSICEVHAVQKAYKQIGPVLIILSCWEPTARLPREVSCRVAGSCRLRSGETNFVVKALFPLLTTCKPASGTSCGGDFVRGASGDGPSAECDGI